MAEIWAEIQPHFWQIVGSIGMIAAIIIKGPSKTEEQKAIKKYDNAQKKEKKAQRKYDKAHEASLKAEEKLRKAYEREAALEEAMKNEK